MLEQIAAGDHDAFETLYALHKQRVFYTAVKILQSRVAAEDALQDIFLKIWVNREKLQGMAMGHFNAWLQTVVRNLLFDKLRERGTQERALDFLLQEGFESYAETTYQESEFQELLKLVQEASQQLSPQLKKVFALSRLQGMKHREIADELGLSQETVKKHIMEALRQVRAYLKTHGKDISIVLLLQLLHG